MSTRLRASLSPAAMLVAILALLLSGAGIGYTAATVGTSDLEKNAVISSKVKNGSLRSKDMVKEQPFAQPALGNGTEGDCIWADAVSQIPGLARVGYRKDRFGTVHLSGIALSTDGAGGDGMCGGGTPLDSIGDYTVYTLPEAMTRRSQPRRHGDPVRRGPLLRQQRVLARGHQLPDPERQRLPASRSRPEQAGHQGRSGPVAAAAPPLITPWSCAGRPRGRSDGSRARGGSLLGCTS